MAQTNILRQNQKTAIIQVLGSAIEDQVVFNPSSIWEPGSTEILSASIDKISWIVTGGIVTLYLGESIIGSFSGNGEIDLAEDYSAKNTDFSFLRGQLRVVTNTTNNYFLILRTKRISISTENASYTFVNDFGETTIVTFVNDLGVTDTVIDEVPTTNAKSIKYTIQASYSNTYQVSDITLLHNNTTSDITEYAIVHTSSIPYVTYSTNIIGGKMRLIARSLYEPTRLIIQKTVIG
jgi:hypothetical protein